MTSRQRVVVVGGGMAAARLAQQLDSTDVDLTVIGEEPQAAYNRVLLAGVLAGQYEPGVVTLPATGARWLSGVRAVRIDRAGRRVVCDDGGGLAYDALVLATGSNPVLPPLRGLLEEGDGELPRGVRAFRTMGDCLALREEAGPGTRAVVIGGGLLGVSAARALASRGARVVLAHRGEHLMGRQLDADASRLLRRYLSRIGVETHTECGVRGLRTEPVAGPGEGQRTVRAKRTVRAVRAVELADGYVLEADVAVLACGVRPRTGLARAAGLEVARGIVVDDRLRTSDERVYAIGDCAEHAGVLYGRAGPAQEQADALARVLLGAPGPGGAGGARSEGGEGTAAGTARYPGTRALTRLTLASPAPARASVLASAPASAPGTASASAPGPAPAPASDAPHPPLDLAAFGDPTPGPEDDVVRLSDATRGVYRKVVVRGDRLVGGILLGDLGAVGALARTWEGDEPLPSAPLLHLLAQEQAHVQTGRAHDGGM
jgi:assimilatory nitrate reductase electron transfer subunit